MYFLEAKIPQKIENTKLLTLFLAEHHCCESKNRPVILQHVTHLSLWHTHFRMTEFLSARIGRHEYKSKRQNGKQEFVIDESLIAEFAEMEVHQFDCCNPYYKDKVWGIFGEQDTLARFEPLFLEHYNRSFHFPGAHTPTAEEVKTWYVPLVEKLMMEYPIAKKSS